MNVWIFGVIQTTDYNILKGIKGGANLSANAHAESDSSSSSTDDGLPALVTTAKKKKKKSTKRSARVEGD